MPLVALLVVWSVCSLGLPPSGSYYLYYCNMSIRKLKLQTRINKHSTIMDISHEPHGKSFYFLEGWGTILFSEMCTWLELGTSILNVLKFYVSSWKLWLSIKFHILFHHFKVLLLKTQNRQGSHWLLTYRRWLSESHSFGG